MTSIERAKMRAVTTDILGPVYMEVGDPGRWGNPFRCGNPPVHIDSRFKLITFT